MERQPHEQPQVVMKKIDAACAAVYVNVKKKNQELFIPWEPSSLWRPLLAPLLGGLDGLAHRPLLRSDPRRPRLLRRLLA